MFRGQTIDISSSTIFRVIIILLILAFLYVVRDILLIFLVSLVLATAMDPFADRLQKHKIPRAVAVFIVYIVLLSIIGLIVALLVPPITEQMRQLTDSVPSLVDAATERYQALQPLIEQYDVEEWVRRVVDYLKPGAEIPKAEGEGFFSKTKSIFGGFASIPIILVISFYLTVDEDGIKRFLRLATPRKHEEYVMNLFERIQLKIARWIQGQLLLAVVMGTVIGFVLWLIGVPYALVFGLIAGLMEFVPVVGPVLAAIPAIIIAFFLSPYHGIEVGIFYIVVNQLENHVLVPKVMQKAVGLHPVIVIFAMLIGAEVGGILGVIIAVPVATIVSVFVRDLLGAPEGDDVQDVVRPKKSSESS